MGLVVVEVVRFQAVINVVVLLVLKQALNPVIWVVVRPTLRVYCREDLTSLVVAVGAAPVEHGRATVPAYVRPAHCSGPDTMLYKAISINMIARLSIHSRFIFTGSPPQ
jgi:hypothetical protein